MILQYAKLRMLAFHYDFLLQYCQPKKFQHVEMDTDSFYLAIAGQNLWDIMLPDMHVKFDEQESSSSVARHVLKKSDGSYKLSCKGLNKTALAEPYDLYKQVFETHNPASGTNRGIRARLNTVYKYEQERCFISYFYCKRKLLQDGSNTEPLDILLSPWIKHDWCQFHWDVHTVTYSWTTCNLSSGYKDTRQTDRDLKKYIER